jgi:hypothetical protein
MSVPEVRQRFLSVEHRINAGLKEHIARLESQHAQDEQKLLLAETTLAAYRAQEKLLRAKLEAAETKVLRSRSEAARWIQANCYGGGENEPDYAMSAYSEDKLWSAIEWWNARAAQQEGKKG